MGEKADNISFVSPVTPAGKHTMEPVVETQTLLNEGLAIPDVEAQVTNEDLYLMDRAELESYTIDSITLETSLEFNVFHSYIFEAISQWRTTKATPAFNLRWKKWLFHGLASDTNFKGVKRKMGITTLPEYLKIVQECEIISKHVAWEW
mmetsp:Transcript_6499/g.9504  ORF Transcript_6499/g.9504 Transcript_6499/m.9504 type:complete len:149 (+) Transcript_6499:210-656(+)